jgi:integrase
MRREIGSIREISPGVWRVMVSVGYSHATGKRRRPSATVRGDERAAGVALAKLILQAGRIPEDNPTVRQFLVEMYLPHAEGRLRRRTAADYRSKIETHILGPLGDLRLGELTPYVLDRWIDEVKGSDRTRLHAYRVLNTALNLAVRWRLIEHNPLNAVEVPKVRDDRKPDVLSAEEAAEYLAAFRGHPLEPVIVLALGAGLRRSELAGLRWSDVSFWTETREDGSTVERGEVSVVRGLHDLQGEVIEEIPKSTTSNRVVALPAWAVAALKPLRALGPIVVEDGAPMRPWRISQEYDRQVKAAKLRRVQLKNLRHSHACLLLDAGVDLYTVSRRLGHSSVAVTESHYVRPGEQADRDAADALGTLRHFAPRANSRQIEDKNCETMGE